MLSLVRLDIFEEAGSQIIFLEFAKYFMLFYCSALVRLIEMQAMNRRE